MNPLAKYAHVEGQIRSIEAMRLYRLALGLPPYAAVVEIGSYRGKSTLALAQGIKDGHGGRVYAIDPHSPKDGYANIDGIIMAANIRASKLHNIMQVDHYSQDALGMVPPMIDLLWIDGDHSPEGVMRDFDLYAPRITRGGIIALHDTQYKGPWAVVDRIIGGNEFGNVRCCWSVTYATRNGRGTTVQNRLAVTAYHKAFAALASVKQAMAGKERDGKTI